NPAAIKELLTGDDDALHAGEASAVLHPLLGANSLLAVDGARHTRERRLMLPPFHGERMLAYGETMRDITDAAIDAWPIGRAFPGQDEMQAITLEVILRTVFGLAEPERLALVRERVRRLVGLVVNPFGLGQVMSLEYLDAVVKETLRLRPVIGEVGRVLKRPMRIGGWDLPAGVEASPSIYLVHRRPDVWSDPERFDPRRFVGRRPSPYEFLPFGGGTRRCLGMAFALYEMKVVLAEELRRVDLVRAPG